MLHAVINYVFVTVKTFNTVDTYVSMCLQSFITLLITVCCICICCQLTSVIVAPAIHTNGDEEAPELKKRDTYIFARN